MADLFVSDYVAPEAAIGLPELRDLFHRLGAGKLFVKALAPNDNSKNQPYLSTDLSILNAFPTGGPELSDSSSAKDRQKRGEPKLTAALDFSWVLPSGETCPAPAAKLIYYPQYPEVRFSGFLAGTGRDRYFSVWLNPSKKGRAPGRFIVFGLCPDGRILGFLAVPYSRLATDLHDEPGIGTVGALTEIAADPRYGKSSRRRLFEELRRIHLKGWIEGKKLGKNGIAMPYRARNGGGFTLEAELGVLPNASPTPDFLDWEVKQFGVTDFDRLSGRAITLMTPQPTGGYYARHGLEAFIRKFGYRDRTGKPNRMNFGGVHIAGAKHPLTKLVMRLDGYEPDGNAVNPAGAIRLVSESDEIAAEWSFEKLIAHWKEKHSHAVYVPSLSRKNGITNYRYGNEILAGEETDFIRVLSALACGEVYFDPGMKLENAFEGKPRVKPRSQFRIKSQSLGRLYRSFGAVDVLEAVPN